MKSVTDIVRPFAKTEFDEWITETLQTAKGNLYRDVYYMDYIAEHKLMNPVRRDVFWTLTNFLSGLLREEFGDSN